MNLLSLDLGVTTGWAVLSDDGELVDYGMYDLIGLGMGLMSVRVSYRPEHVVGESPVIFRGPLGTQLEHVVANARYVFPEMEEIGPASWKKPPWNSYPVPSRISIHERDAIRIGYYYLNEQLKTLSQDDNIE